MSFLNVLALGINTIVGSGIFRLPAEMAAALGPASILVFIGCALFLALVALAFAEAASLFDKDGGAYLYAREAFGEVTGFLVGWTLWLATVLTWATVAAAIPGQLGLPESSALFVIFGLGAVALFGLQPAAWVSSIFAAVKLVPLVLFVLVGIFYVQLDHFTPFAPRSTAQLPTTIAVAFFALSGFEAAAIPGGGASPWAIISSLVGAAILYALIQFVALGVAPDLAHSLSPLADASRVFLGDSSATLFAWAGAISMLGLCAATAITAPMMLSALSRDHLLPARLGGPRPAVILSTVAAAACAVAYDFRGLVGFTSVTLILQYLATVAAVPVLRRKLPAARRVARLPRWLLTIAAAGLLYLLSLSQPSELLGAALVSALGLLIYGVHRMQRAAWTS